MHEAWQAPTKVLHWLSVLALLVIVPVGYLMTAMYGYTLKYAEFEPGFISTSQIHHTLGFAILLMTILRLYFRSRQPTSDKRSTIATLLQYGLYLVLIALPISGWAALSALADSAEFGQTQIWFFQFDNIVPKIIEPKHWSDATGYSRFASIHRYLIYFGAALLSVHIGAAFYHHWLKKDQTLINILPKR